MPGMVKASVAAKGVCGGNGTGPAAVVVAVSAVVAPLSAVGPAGSAVIAQSWLFMLELGAVALAVLAKSMA